MGVPAEWRKFLFTLLAKRGCFFEALPPARAAVPFDVVIIDAMQELALVKHGDAYQSGTAIGNHMKQSLYRHLVPSGYGDVVAARLLVACLDNAYTVPRNKAFTEASRDGSETHIRKTEDFDAVVQHAKALRVAHTRHNLPEGTSVRVAEIHEQNMRDAFRLETHFLVPRQGDFPTDGSRVWRNACLSWQLKRLVTEAAMEMEVPEGKALLLDDGIVLSEAQYAELARTMLADHGYDTPAHSSLARASLIGQLMSVRVERVLMQPRRRYRTLPSTHIGESDHKILYYVQRALPLGLTKPAGRRGAYLVKCQDTDVLWALLAHVPTLINPATGVVDEVEVWLDSQMPSDRANGTSRPYRLVDVVACWRALHDTLVEEFPTLKNPVESFLALVFSNANDYVEAFAAPLKLGPGTLWHTWAQSLCLSSEHKDYPSFSQEGKREKVSPGFPMQMSGIVDDWVVYRAPPPNAPAAPCLIQLRHDLAARFFYGVVQRSPLLSNFAKRFQSKSVWAQRGAAFEPDAAALMEVLADLTGLATAEGDLAVPPLLSVPTKAGMRARIARINWTLDYYVNGWKTPAYTYNWFQATAEYPRHGWAAVEHEEDAGSGVALTSQYYYAEYIPPRIDAFGAPVRGRYRLLQPMLAYEVAEPVF